MRTSAPSSLRMLEEMREVNEDFRGHLGFSSVRFLAVIAMRVSRSGG